MAEEQKKIFSFVLGKMEICERPHHTVRCYHCRRRFIAGEEYVRVITSGGGAHYSPHYSRFCLDCVIKALIQDTHFTEGIIQARDRARLEALKENQAKSARERGENNERRDSGNS